MDYQKELSELIRFQETGQGKHEWIFDEKQKADAVRFANYLRGHGYRVTFKHYPNCGQLFGIGYYVGVPSDSLK